MRKILYQVKRTLFSGQLWKMYLPLMSIFFYLAVKFFKTYKNIEPLGEPIHEFYWQSSLGIFAGMFVGFVVDAVEGFNRTKYLSLVLSGIRIEDPLPIVVAKLPNCEPSCINSRSKYTRTGPGETMAIGLIYSAYSTLFSTASNAVKGSRISVRPSDNRGDIKHDEMDFENQCVVLGGPKYNLHTRRLLDLPKINIHYLKVAENTFIHTLKLKKGDMEWKCEDRPDEKIPGDYGLVIKIGRQLHASGCQTWGVIGAASCLFTEAYAKLLVEKLETENIDPITDNYFAVIYCKVPNSNEHYSIGEVSILHAEKIIH